MKYLGVMLLMFSGCVAAEEVYYEQDGLYRLISSKHLINDVAYKKDDRYQIIVEIPAGSRRKWEVNHKSGHLEWEFKNNKPRKVKFLGYPGNYGFIPQTISGDGDALDIIVLSESAKLGDVLRVKVIGMLEVTDKGEEDNKVIALTDDGAFKKIDTIKELLLKKPNAVSIVKLWFEGYKGNGKIVFMGYKNRKKTIEYIEDSHVSWSKLSH